MDSATRETIREQLAGPRAQLEANLLNADLRECKLTDLGDIMLPFDALTQVYHQHGLSDFEQSIAFCNNLLGDIATEHISHFTGLSYVLAVYELMDEVTASYLEGNEDLSNFHQFLEKIQQTFKGVENVKAALAAPEQTIVQDMPPMDIVQDGSVSDFISEVTEGLELVEESLLELERDPGQLSLVDTVFRMMHTIKGTSGFLGMPTIGKIGHRTEDILGEIRDGKRGLDANVFDLMFRSVDTLKNLIAQLVAMVQGKPVEPVNIGKFFKALETVQGSLTEPGATPAPPPPRPPAASPGEAEESIEEVEESSASSEAPAAPAAEASGRKGSAGKIQEMLKVPAERLDELSNLVGEMVVALSLLTQNPVVFELADRNVHAQLDHLDKITESLRDKVLGIRMFPIGTVFSKLSRQVRDLSQKSGKKINLEVIGADTLVDKSIIDNIYAPLMHLVRNSIDHGIEPPGERGDKPEEGLVQLKAQHLGDAIEIEISDDGKGLDPVKLLDKAEEKGLVKNRESLTEKEIFAFIFAAGFSTAKVVTDISGRGVGMDVVRRTIESLRGKIDTQSKLGEGTRFSLKMPLTTSIIEGLVIAVGGHRFIMPILDVLQTITPTSGDLKGVQGKEDEFFLLAGEMIPILRLYEIYRIEPKITNPSKSVVVVVTAGNRKYGIMVDELLHRQQIVIQPLGERFKHLKGLSGGTILGDGRVGLILDPVSLIQGLHLHQES
ncbi:MAG: chemotaxis protein CheA [bacterium]|nr:chemotaxis protein CheA [bacterium]